MKLSMRSISSFVLFLVLSGNTIAQAPAINLSGLPADPLIGENACFDAEFSNSAATIGYGPYLVVTYPPNLDVESVKFINVNASVEDLGTFGPTGQLTDPVTGNTITGLENGKAYLYRYPIGAVANTSPTFALTICTKPSASAEIYTALPVGVTPGFEFGDTPTGANGAVVTPEVSNTVTPILARMTKTSTAPEGERPPGPSHSYTYNIVVDISDQATIDNVLFEDILPAQLQWTGTSATDITVNATNGTNCTVDTTPNVDSNPANKDINNPGGNLAISCDDLTGTASSADFTVSFEVFAVDILTDSANNSQVTVTNEATLTGDYNGTPIAPALSDDVGVTIRQSTMIKSVTGSNTPSANDLVYTLNFRVSDYTTGATAYTLIDELPDGISYTTSSASVQINGASQTPSEPTVAPNTPAAGQTRLTWDIRSIFGADLPDGTTGSISYDASIDLYYANGQAVAAEDRLTNNADTDYTLSEGGVSQNTSSAAIEIAPNTLKKSIVDPNPVPTSFTPGQAVTFRLEMEIPAGSTDNVILTDYMPLPVIPVGTAVGAANSNITSVTIPTDPAFLQESSTGVPLAGNYVVATNPADNSVTITFNNDFVVASATTLAVDIATTVTADPYADGLVLSNLMRMDYNNTTTIGFDELFTINIALDAPEIDITAGVTDATNPDASYSPASPPDPSTVLAESDVRNIDAGDTLTYTFTVENTGGSDAYNVLITSPNVSGLTCDNSTISIVNGNGAVLTYTGTDLSAGIELDNALPANDGNPAGGGAPFGTDTALVSIECTVDSAVDVSSTLTKSANAIWTATPSGTGTFPPVSDAADATLANPSVEKSYTTIAPVGAAAAANIGEVVTYNVVVTVPEGVMPAARVVDTLPAGMAVVAVDSITASSADLTSNLGAISGISATISGVGGAAVDQGRVITLNFGTLTNANSDNSVDETITITFRAQVLNVPSNNQGTSLVNRARLNWTPSGGAARNTTANSDPITVNEPTLTVSKTFSQTTGDHSTAFTGTIVINNTSSTDAYDVALADLLAGDMSYSNITFTGSCGTYTDTLDGAASPETLDVSWSTFPAGASCTITYDVDFEANPVAGSVLTAPVNLTWESINGAPPASTTHNGFGVERTGSPADTGGAANDYLANNSATFTVSGASISKTLQSTNATITDGLAVTPAGGSALTIGESITFTIAVTIPEVNVSNLTITDSLPTTNMDFEITGISVPVIGADLNVTTPAPTPTYSNSGGAAANDTVTLDFGTVTHTVLDGTNADDQISIEVTAIVLNVGTNANGNEANNSASVDFGGAALATAQYPMEIAEPLLSVNKSASPNPAVAGQTVTYTVTVSHAPGSTMAATDVSIEDTLPAGVTLVNGSNGVGTCTNAPASSSATGGVFSASWSNFPLGQSCELTYQATVSTTAVYGDNIDNTADLDWYSLANTFAGRRTYNRSDTETLTISEPGVSIEMVDSNNTDTPFTPGATDNGITIGETATFDITVTLPDGKVDDAVLEALLPNIGVSVDYVSSEIFSIGGDISIGSGLVVGAPGGACTPASANCLAWDLGDVTNATGAGGETIVIRVVAIVNDDAGNTVTDTGLPVVAQLKSQQSDGTPNTPLTDNTTFDIVVPVLDIEKLTGNGTDTAQVDAGDVHRFTLTVDNTAPASSATAQNVQVGDTLNADMLWVNNTNVTSTCAGFAIVSSPANGTTGTVAFTMDNLPLGSSCDIEYDVQMTATVVLPGNYPNSAQVSWDSTTGSAQNRASTVTDAATLQTLVNATINKTINSSSVTATGDAQHTAGVADATIGEEIEYYLTMTFAEGITENVELVDTLQSDAAGVLEYLSSDVMSVGGNITTGFLAPVVAGNTITFTFGTVNNAPDGVDNVNDQIIVRVRARVLDDAANQDGDVLNNEGVLSFDGGLPINSSVDIDVVSPALTLTNDYSDFTDGTATVSLTLENTGTADAYEPVISQTFDASIWDASSITGTNIPPGYQLVVDTSVPGVITVTLETLGDATDPNQVLSPGETANFEFTIDMLPTATVTTVNSTANASATTLPGDDASALANEREVTTSDPATLGVPRLAAEKTVVDVNGGNIEPGDVLTYTITVNNAGGGAASNVVISDTPATLSPLNVSSVSTTGGTGPNITSGNTAGDTSVSVTFASIAAASSASVSYQVTVANPYPDGKTAAQSLSNQADIDYDEGSAFVSNDPTTPAGDDATVVEVVADPVMNISKNDGVTSINAGNTLVYTITYANNGDQDASGVVITETVPANTTFNAGSSTAGWSCAGTGAGSTCTFTVGDVAGGGANGTVNFAVDVSGSIAIGVTTLTNNVSIAEDGAEFGLPDSVPSSATDTEITPIIAAPHFVLTKTDGGRSTVPGAVVVYTLQYENNGTQDASGVELTETVPANTTFSAGSSTAGWSCADGSPASTPCTLTIGTLANGASGTAQFAVLVDNPAVVGLTQLTNSASIRDDGSSSAGVVSESANDTTPVNAQHDLSITNTASTGRVEVGDTVVFTSTATLGGNQNTNGVVVTVTIPDGTTFNAAGSDPAWVCTGTSAGDTCTATIGAMTVGDSVSFDFAVDVVSEPANRRIDNIVSVADDGSNGPETNTGNNTALARTAFPSLEVPTMGFYQLMVLVGLITLLGARRRRV